LARRRPLCFVLVPLGAKRDASGSSIDFDAVYAELVRPAVEAAGLEPVRADDEMSDGAIRKPTLERLSLCEYLVVDLTNATASLLADIGDPHAARRVTVWLIADGREDLLDTTSLHVIRYRVDAGKLTGVDVTRQAITRRLQAGRNQGTTAALADLLNWPTLPDIAHESTDVFRERAVYSEERKRQLAEARASGKGALGALREIEASLGSLSATEVGVVIDIFLSYRAVKAWDDMIRLVDAMDSPLRETKMVQEQLALALNRAGRGEEAERLLLDLIETRGGTSETYAILGRVYKDRWDAGSKVQGDALASGLLQMAIDAYARGFEADSRDALPGVNAVTLMELRDPPDPRRLSLTPVVRYAVEQKMRRGRTDYWDHATLVELAVLAKDESGAADALAAALPLVREVWEPETTARNLRLIREARERRGEILLWATRIEQSLVEAGQRAG
jgi:hypothetical protein